MEVEEKKGSDGRRVYQLTERTSVGKRGLVRILAEMAEDGDIRGTLYLKPASTAAGVRPSLRAREGGCPGEVAGLLEHLGSSGTGGVIFWGDLRAVAIEPPFPVRYDAPYDGFESRPLLDQLDVELVIGVVLLRLGRYAVGVLRGERLVASRTGSRYVKARHRAGGSSQRRFERSRERLVRELYDKTCAVCREVFSPFEKTMDYLLLGGERGVLRGYLDRCAYLDRIGAARPDRVLRVDRPGQEALNRIAYHVWKSGVLRFERQPS